jgi:hypothetical protein
MDAAVGDFLLLSFLSIAQQTPVKEQEKLT